MDVSTWCALEAAIAVLKHVEEKGWAKKGDVRRAIDELERLQKEGKL